jgi:hypothetical protein
MIMNLHVWNFDLSSLLILICCFILLLLHRSLSTQSSSLTFTKRARLPDTWHTPSWHMTQWDALLTHDTMRHSLHHFMYLRLSKRVCILLKKTSLFFTLFQPILYFHYWYIIRSWNWIQISYWKWITTFKISMFRTVSSVSIYHEHGDYTTNR